MTNIIVEDKNFYVLRYRDSGRLETGHASSAVPKLYKIGNAKSVCRNKNRLINEIDGPCEIYPLTGFNLGERVDFEYPDFKKIESWDVEFWEYVWVAGKPPQAPLNTMRGVSGAEALKQQELWSNHGYVKFNPSV